MKEFQLIAKYFTGRSQSRRDVQIGIGDDCALVTPAENKSIAISCDTLVENVHFYPDIPAKHLGYKSLAVNLSDLAAMGAEPAWMTLALTMPEVDETWLEQYTEGLFEVADYYGVSLIGGDTTRGTRAITITVHGQVPTDKALRRNTAQAGDWIYVTGTLGDSALGLDILRNKQQVPGQYESYLTHRHYRPTPRVLAGQSLRNLASSAIDISDGIVSDITHILKGSELGAVISVEDLPLSEAMQASVSNDEAIGYALTGGEDYELLFTIPEAQKGALETTLGQTGVKFTQIGQMTQGTSLRLLKDGESYIPANYSFEHF